MRNETKATEGTMKAATHPTQEIYWNGLRTVLTGKRETMYGGTFLEARILEGCRRGMLILIRDEYLGIPK